MKCTRFALVILALVAGRVGQAPASTYTYNNLSSNPGLPYPDDRRGQSG